MSGDLIDYKFFCFDGDVKALYVATDRQLKDEETIFYLIISMYGFICFL